MGLPELSSYSESELEQKLIDKLEHLYASKYLTILPNKEELKKLLEDE